MFEMSERGLIPVNDPSAVLLANRPDGAPGSVVCAAVSGTRPLLVEIQALVSPLGPGRAPAAGPGGGLGPPGHALRGAFDPRRA